jgi:hypothetical protein
MSRPQLALVALLLGGCGTAENTVRARAAYDFRCDEDRVDVRNISGSTFEASGCGKRTVYTCSSIDSLTDDIACIHDQEKASDR